MCAFVGALMSPSLNKAGDGGAESKRGGTEVARRGRLPSTTQAFAVLRRSSSHLHQSFSEVIPSSSQVIMEPKGALQLQSGISTTRPSIPVSLLLFSLCASQIALGGQEGVSVQVKLQ